MKPYYMVSKGVKEVLMVQEIIDVINHISREFPKPVGNMTVSKTVIHVTYNSIAVYIRLPHEAEEARGVNVDYKL
ncbi:hypothetical protein [Bacillus paramobilis]|uniref:hypothetical protein n=1 Tax=Bacillus paramobilis TaxID=2817477 RepID=UPI001BB33982|nr:hypothetical protein [Bacillus paramobilis]HEF5065765.1 hypothetical protein [Bacillus cereus]HEF5237749.1 hypothetical protein [Bacillus cereus]